MWVKKERTMADLITRIEGLLRPKGHKGLAGIFTDEHKVVEAARKTREMGIKKFEAISPYPIHSIDDAMGIPRSYIAYICFAAGLTGCIFGVWFTWWTSAVSWPLVIGGKPLWSLAAFIPVIFECTILFAALTSVGAMLVINGLPAIDPPTIDLDLTSHKFAIFVREDEKGYDAAKLEQIFRSLGASDVRRTEF
jgi:Protein of unknown function (DUF3341)